MVENESVIYFAKCGLLNVTEVVLKSAELKKEDRNLLEQILWEIGLRYQSNHSGESRNVAQQKGWQQSWRALGLLLVLQERPLAGEPSGLTLDTLDASRREVYFTSLLLHLEDLATEDRKALKTFYNKVLLSNLISKSNIIPRLTASTEEALLRSLIHQPGETHFLLQLLSCGHEAFVEVIKGIKNIYISAISYCVHGISNCDDDSKKKLLNTFYSLLLVFPYENSLTEDVGHSLYSLTQATRRPVDLHTLLMVTSCQAGRFLYNYLVDRENRRLMRHVDCINATDAKLINNVFNVVSKDNDLCLEELCLRTIHSKCHWVEEIIAMATQFAAVKDESKLKLLMFVPALWPALAISVWRQWADRPDVFDFIIPILNTCQELYPDVYSHLVEAVGRLKVITDWLHHETGSVANLPDKNVMLSLIRSHSVLYVLQATTHFVGLDHSHLAQLLRQVEGPDSWNVKIFDGFRILFSMFEVLVKAVDIFNEFDEKDNIALCHKYKEEVSNSMSDLIERVKKITPLNLRLEIMEDIFLLLFLRSEDFCEAKCADNSSAEEAEDLQDLVTPVFAEEPLSRPMSWPMAQLGLHKKTSSSRVSTSSSYPSTSQRKYSGHLRRPSKVSV